MSRPVFNFSSLPLSAGRSIQRGFTLMEVIVAMAIMAVLMGVGIPAIGDWIQNRQVTALAESIASGLRLAQIEAVQRNAAVDMVFTTSSVISPSNPSTVTLTSGGLTKTDPSPNWMVRVAGDTTSAGFLQGKMAQDGSENARFSGVAGFRFSPLGRLNASIAADGTTSVPTGNVVLRIANPSVKSSPATLRCVFVSPGGSVRICDPHAPSGNSRACVPPLASTDCPAS